MSAQSRQRPPSSSATPFGSLLRSHRERAGLTQEELAERAALSTDAVSALERGARRRAQPKTMRALAAALELTAAERTAFFAAVTQPRGGAPNLTPWVASDPRPGFPHPLTPLVGRQREADAARALLAQDDVRLLTLLGPGGVGKSRLSLAIATASAEHFEMTAFGDLAPLHDPAFVASVIARALGLLEQGARDPLDRLTESIADRSTLLLLDNFEHLPAAAPVVGELLARCCRLKLLVTSRAALRIRGEYEFPVSPLAVPDEVERGAPELSPPELLDFPAVRLFVDRTRAVHPDFDLTAANAAAVAEICRRLDGLPLALELAAARTRILPPSALLSQLSSRLTLLIEGPVDAPMRHRTLRGAIDWSHDLLSAEEQILFRRLSVFVGGFTLEAAAYVREASPPLRLALLAGVESLVSKSLLQRSGMTDDGLPRFSMLETVREYGLEQLAASGEEETVRDAHAACFLALAERAAAERIGTGQRLWLDRLEAEHPNLRAALDWLTERDAPAALRLAAACAWFWWFRGHYAEGRARLEGLVTRPGMSAHTRPWAAAMTACGLLTHSLGENGRAVQLHEQAVAVWRGLDDPDRLAEALYLHSIALLYTGDARAVRVASEFLVIARRLTDRRWLGVALWALGRAYYYQGELDQAAELLDEALRQVRKSGSPLATGFVHWTLGEVAWDQGAGVQALQLLKQGLTHLWDLKETWSVLLCLERLGLIAARDQPLTAARLFAAAAAWRDSVGLTRPAVDDVRYQRALKAICETTSRDAFLAAWADGQALSPEQAVVEALEINPAVA